MQSREPARRLTSPRQARGGWEKGEQDIPTSAKTPPILVFQNGRRLSQNKTKESPKIEVRTRRREKRKEREDTSQAQPGQRWGQVNRANRGQREWRARYHPSTTHPTRSEGRRWKVEADRTHRAGGTRKAVPLRDPGHTCVAARTSETSADEVVRRNFQRADHFTSILTTLLV